MHLAAVLKEDGDWAVVIGALVGALILAFVVDRALSRRTEQLAAAVTRGQMSRETATRLRFVRRVIYSVILLVGVAIALSQFKGVDEVAASLLASGVVAAAIIGFAARQTLANTVAGVMLAVTQPLRVGDWVTFEGHYGVVEDVRLNYTVLRTPSEQRIVIPNERLAGGIMRNDTLVVAAVSLDVSVWIDPGADADRAVRVLAEETSGGASVAEATPDGIRISVTGERVTPAEKGAREADLRGRCLRRLHGEGLLPGMQAAEPR
jgi:small-conductance mechanosensitive channel